MGAYVTSRSNGFGIMRFLPITLLAPLLAAQTGTVPLRSVTAVRRTALPAATRITVSVSGTFDFHWDRLHDPERVYYDILNAEPKFGSTRSYTDWPDDPLVSRIRVAETRPGVTRVVLDLKGASEVKAAKLTAPDRLSVEIRAAAPVSTAGGGEPGAAPATIETSRPATRTSAGENSLTRALGLKIARVVIDPGHGGHDQGTEGPQGLLEKDLVLDVAQRLGGMIEDRLGAEVLYTRSDDTYVPLEGRTAFANEKKADLFLSVHANFSSLPTVAGIETFYLNVKGTKYSMDVAARENASSQTSVFELADMIQKIARQDKADESLEFANRVQASLFTFSARNVAGSKNRGVKPAPFVVLIGAHMPSVLTEIGFLSNPKEESLLKRADYRQRLADAIYKGVAKYAESLSHFQVEPAPAAKAVAKTGDSFQ